ncbi:hypothetical protein PIROE2DRAFT_19393, partial [Piromyces sp. E2]
INSNTVINGLNIDTNTYTNTKANTINLNIDTIFSNINNSDTNNESKFNTDNNFNNINTNTINTSINNDNNTINKINSHNNIMNTNFSSNSLNRNFDKDSFLYLTDNKQIYYEILKRISYDDNFFVRKYNLLKIKCKYNVSQTVFDMYQAIMLSLNEFSKKKNWTKFSLITGAQRIYLNREYAMYVIKHPEKAKNYPIAKSIAIASKTADDCTIGLLLLLEAAKESNDLPIRFAYGKSWVFYQCCIIYIIRYVATQESKYIKYYSKESLKYSSFSSYPQETLAPCYFYLDLLKQMSSYFPHVQNIIREIKLLIYQAERAIREKTFDIVINNILFSNII